MPIAQSPNLNFGTTIAAPSCVMTITAMKHRAALTSALALALVSVASPVSAAAALVPTHLGALRAPILTRGSWPMYHRDNAHTGADLSLSNVTSVKAGWVSPVMDAQVYASPLIFGGIVYAATLNNTVYAFNQVDGSLVWSTPMPGAPETRGWRCGNISPQGILGTPVIDSLTGRIYAAALITDPVGTNDVYHLFGLNLSTGAIELDTTLNIPGFDWTIQQERGALSVANGFVYVPFGGRAGDCGNYSGWVVGVPTDGSGNVAGHLKIFQTSNTGNGLWSAGGLIIDGSGNVYGTTGNGVNNGSGDGCIADGSGNPIFQNDAVVRLSPTLTQPSGPAGYFMPIDWQANWCQNDQDLGGISPVLIAPNLIFQTGKWGDGFLLNPASLGGVGGQLYPSPGSTLATYTNAPVCFGNKSDATFGSQAYAAPFVYLECEGGGLVAIHVDASAPSFTPCATSPCPSPDWNAGAGLTFGPPIVAGGVVWAAVHCNSDLSNSPICTPGTTDGLYGFRADNGQLVYHSAGFASNRFSTLAEAGGRIFVSSDKVIMSFVMGFGVAQSIRPPAPIRPPVLPTSAPPPAGRPPLPQTSPAPKPFGR